jgi:hypothetical protein
MAEEIREPVDARALTRQVQIVLGGLAAMLHLDEGTWTFEVVFKQGEPQRAFWKRGPVGMDELDELAAR